MIKRIVTLETQFEIIFSSATYCLTWTSLASDCCMFLYLTKIFKTFSSLSSSCLGRFTRRRQQLLEDKLLGSEQMAKNEKDPTISTLRTSLLTPSTVVEAAEELDIPEYYFSNREIDDTVAYLKSLPWKNIFQKEKDVITKHKSPSHSNSPTITVDNDSSSDLVLNEEFWDEYCTSKLCGLDEALVQVQSNLSQSAKPNCDNIQQANSCLHEFDQSLRLAFMYWNRSKEALTNAIGGSDIEGDGLIDGPRILLELWDQQYEHKQLHDVLEKLADIWEQEQLLLERIDNFDARSGNALEEYFNVRQTAFELERAINNDCSTVSLKNLQCLNEMRIRLGSLDQRVWRRLLTLCESVIVRCSRNIPFNWTEYDSLLRAVLDLQGSSVGLSLTNNFDWVLSWTVNIVDALSFESERSLAVALLEVSSCDEDRDSYGNELTELNQALDSDWGDFSKLRLITNQLISIRFDSSVPSHRHKDDGNRGFYLARIYGKLCQLLTSVLNSYALFIDWHQTQVSKCTLHENETSDDDSNQDKYLKLITRSLIGSKNQIWKACEMVLAKCLDEYLEFAPKRVLFIPVHPLANTIDESVWIEELNGLHDIQTLTNMFLAMKHSFLQLGLSSTPTRDINEAMFEKSPNSKSSIVLEKFTELCRIHLRSVHVTAMTSVGKRLANETWVLGSLPVPTELEKIDKTLPKVESTLLSALLATASPSRVKEALSNFHRPLSDQNLTENELPKIIFPFQENLFSKFTLADSDCNVDIFQHYCHTDNETLSEVDLAARLEVHTTLNSLLKENASDTRIAPDAVSCELIPWFTRLLVTMYKLPLLSEATSLVFASLCDLYFLTVFRICTGNAKSERILLGIDRPPCLPLMLYEERLSLSKGVENTPTSPIFRQFLGGKVKRNTSAITNKKFSCRSTSVASPHLDAEICSPTLKGELSLIALQQYVQKAQSNLSKVVNLNMVDNWMVVPIDERKSEIERAFDISRVVEKRIGAAWSCYTVASLLEVAYSVAKNNNARLVERYGCEYCATLESFRDYTREIMSITKSFVSVATRVSCTRAISGSEIVNDVIKVGTGWEEGKLNEYHNEYIDSACDRAALIWGFLSGSGKLPDHVLNATWECIITVSNLSLLEGFARIQYCSTEGRSLMTLDLASFCAGLSSSAVQERLHDDDERSSLMVITKRTHIDAVAISRQMTQYVDMYVKVFYYPLEDAVKWVEANRENYRFNHAIALIVAIANSMPEPNPELLYDKLVDEISDIYKEVCIR
jgi:Protein of unknown function C-terminus (DUF2451)